VRRPLVEAGAVQHVEHMAPDAREVRPRLGGAEDRQRRPLGRGVLERVVQRVDLRAQRSDTRDRRGAATAPRSCRCARGPTPAATSAGDLAGEVVLVERLQQRSERLRGSARARGASSSAFTRRPPPDEAAGPRRLRTARRRRAGRRPGQAAARRSTLDVGGSTSRLSPTAGEAAEVRRAAAPGR
jgi:hypothetical protein